MKKNVVVLCFTAILFAGRVHSQDYFTKFKTLLSQKDTAAQRALLDTWRVERPNDPELYVSYFNYYTSLARYERIIMSGELNGKVEPVLQLFNTDSTSQTPDGYMYSDIGFRDNLLEKGFACIDTGITQNPTRLDMRFGKIYMLEQSGEYKSMAIEVIKVIDYSIAIKHKWLWSEGKPRKDAEDFMLSNVQGYCAKLYNTEDDDLLIYIKQIAEVVLKYYPEQVEALSNLSIYYLLNEDYDNALPLLLKAEKKAPKDCVVLGNIAQAYKLKGNKKNAAKYYTLITKYGDADAKNFAQQQLEKLKQTQ